MSVEKKRTEQLNLWLPTSSFLIADIVWIIVTHFEEEE